MGLGENLFGEEIQKDVLLRDKFMEPPFSILDANGGEWQNRKRKWKSIGIESEIGRDVTVIDNTFNEKYGRKGMPEASIFDPALTELLINWFCPEGGKIRDWFAGGSVRGIVSNYIGRKYEGHELRHEQVDANILQAKKILPANNQPIWIAGDSNKTLENHYEEKDDFALTCPPYHDLEVYSDNPDDLSNMPYDKFIQVYRSIIKKGCDRLKSGAYAAIVVGDIRDKKTGAYKGFVLHTVQAYIDAGMDYYNHAILRQPLGTAMLRANRVFGSNKKLVKVHEDVLIFKKP